MKQIEDTKTIDFRLEKKRGRDRPPKIDALTGAERGRGFFAAHLMDDTPPSPAADLQTAHAEARLLVEKIADLQLQLDCERQGRIDAERRLATLKAKMKK